MPMEFTISWNHVGHAGFVCKHCKHPPPVCQLKEVIGSMHAFFIVARGNPIYNQWIFPRTFEEWTDEKPVKMLLVVAIIFKQHCCLWDSFSDLVLHPLCCTCKEIICVIIVEVCEWNIMLSIYGFSWTKIHSVVFLDHLAGQRQVSNATSFYESPDIELNKFSHIMPFNMLFFTILLILPSLKKTLKICWYWCCCCVCEAGPVEVFKFVVVMLKLKTKFVITESNRNGIKAFLKSRGKVDCRMMGLEWICSPSSSSIVN